MAEWNGLLKQFSNWYAQGMKTVPIEAKLLIIFQREQKEIND